MKPFDPTPSRLERARREGDHPVSRDLVAVATLCGALGGMSLILPMLHATLPVDLRALLVREPAPRLWITLSAAVALSCGCGSACAILATALQTQGLRVYPLGFHVKWAHIFGIRSAAEATRSAIAIAAGALGMVQAIRPVPGAIARVIAIAVVVGIVNAVCDLLATRISWRRRLRMTHDELRRDLREHDGDPHTRTRRRRLHRALLRGGLRHVRRASFVILNPTHIAIALRYAPPEVPVPTILVRAADAGALRVRTLAAELRIPMVENPELARRLYAHDALGPIPPELYLAVAQIVAVLLRPS